MLKSQEMKAFSYFNPLFQVFVCAVCRSQLNTLQLNTQTGVPAVPCRVPCPNRFFPQSQ
jgi:hypothetical protein